MESLPKHEQRDNFTSAHGLSDFHRLLLSEMTVPLARPKTMKEAGNCDNGDLVFGLSQCMGAGFPPRFPEKIMRDQKNESPSLTP